MRDQYVGDITDLIKFSLLCELVGGDRKLGVAWYYVPWNDNRPDGRHTEWQTEPIWKRLDPVVFDNLVNLPERNVASLEAASFWPRGVCFHREPVPAVSSRDIWSDDMARTLAGCNLVFLDPDTGLSGPTDDKHVTPSEIRRLHQPGRTIVLISFSRAQKTHTATLHEMLLSEESGARSVITLRTNVSVPERPGATKVVQRARWFTLIDPDNDLIERMVRFSGMLKRLPRANASITPIERSL